MRLKHFLEHMAKIDGWKLQDDGVQAGCIRRQEGDNCECPMTAVGRVAIPCNNLNVGAYKSVALDLNLPTAIAAAADRFAHLTHAPENLAELREHLLKAARLA